MVQKTDDYNSLVDCGFIRWIKDMQLHINSIRYIHSTACEIIRLLQRIIINNVNQKELLKKKNTIETVVLSNIFIMKLCEVNYNN